jgi:hypothetical protein
MGFNFERFQAFGSSFAPKVSIRNNGQIGISQGALRKMKISGDGHYVVLFFDVEARVIGLKANAAKDEQGAIEVHVRPVTKDGSAGSVTAHISGRSFLECYGIPYKDKSRTYVPEWNEESGMFIVDLNKEKGGKRRRKIDPACGDDDEGRESEEGGNDEDKLC